MRKKRGDSSISTRFKAIEWMISKEKLIYLGAGGRTDGRAAGGEWKFKFNFDGVGWNSIVYTILFKTLDFLLIKLNASACIKETYYTYE